MAQTGQCCEHAGDCATGICIGGACWPEYDTDDEKRDQFVKVAVIIGVIVIALICACVISIKCMNANIKMRINLKTSNL